jgi:membrane-bound lytic murein transglycosylase MltF
MTEVNKVLFAFASYNAGRARISRLRKDAAEMDLDPNVWFHNVEVLAPAETRTYVANIYKYFVAYTLIEEEQAERRKAKEELSD